MFKIGLNNIKNFCPREVDLFSYDNNVSSFIKYLIKNKKVTGSFRVTNLSIIERQVRLWKRQLPDVTPLKIVDIGGGFPRNSNRYFGKNSTTFEDIVKTLQLGIHEFRKRLANNDNIQFIAELLSLKNRVFVSDAVTVATQIYFRKGDNPQSLYVDDGVYGTCMPTAM